MTVTFMKTGAASAAMAQKEEARKEAEYAQRGKMYRFFMKEGETGRRVTFVDGVLSDDGFLLPPRFYEHNLFLAGQWGNHFVCPEHSSPEAGEKCPICQGGDKPYLAALFTIIDHQEFVVQKGPNKGKVYKDQKRLYVAKSQTMEILTKKAQKWGGLAGLTVDIDRIGENSPGVGNGFEKIEQNPVEALVKKYGMEKLKDADGKDIELPYFRPADYSFEITYRTAEELLKMGLGASTVTAPNMMSPGGKGSSGKANYGGQL